MDFILNWHGSDVDALFNYLCIVLIDLLHFASVSFTRVSMMNFAHVSFARFCRDEDKRVVPFSCADKPI